MNDCCKTNFIRGYYYGAFGYALRHFIVKNDFDMSLSIEECSLIYARHIPRLPHKYVDMCGVERNGCPFCFGTENRNEILYAGQKYCSVCGQAITYEEGK